MRSGKELRSASEAVSRQPDSHEVMTPDETARYLKVAPATLKDWRTKGRGPVWVRLSGQIVRYRRRDVDRWLAATIVDPELR